MITIQMKDNEMKEFSRKPYSYFIINLYIIIDNNNYI
jgi:hypothetical protein